jgi:hypothetical protein
MRRALIVALAAALVVVPTAGAWTWPVKGPVLQKFVLGDDPYAAGQHRGIDIGAAAGDPVVAAASGTVSFVGTVPASGKVVTIQTADGFSVTLTHLGSTTVLRGETVAEGTLVGTIGPSGDLEHEAPYVHLGVRHSEDSNGYVDPLLYLPAPTAPPVAPPPASPVTPAPSRAASPAPAAQPSAAPAASASGPPASAPAAPAVRVAGARQSTAARPHAPLTGEPRAHSVSRARAATKKAAVSPTVHDLRSAARLSRTVRNSVRTSPATPAQPAGSEPVLPAASRPALAEFGRADGSDDSAAGAPMARHSSHGAVWLCPAVLLIGLAAVAVSRRRKRASGVRKTAPIIDSNVALLPDNPDLLRELDPAHRARVHDDRRRHPRAASPPARRRDVLPDRHGRKRFQERACGGRGRGRSKDLRRPARRRPLAAAARPRRRVSGLLHPDNG